jgi:hypothetical protein
VTRERETSAPPPSGSGTGEGLFSVSSWAAARQLRCKPGPIKKKDDGPDRSSFFVRDMMIPLEGLEGKLKKR